LALSTDNITKPLCKQRNVGYSNERGKRAYDDSCMIKLSEQIEIYFFSKLNMAMVYHTKNKPTLTGSSKAFSWK
jgi:hypothetical protein